MPELREVWQLCNARKPDIVRYDPVTKSIEIVEITICYDLYFEQALYGKHEKHLHLLNVLKNLGFKVKMHALWLYVFVMSRTRFRGNPHSIVAWMSRNSSPVVCVIFGSLGNVQKQCSKMVRKIYKNREEAKNILKWCSIFIIMGANHTREIGLRGYYCDIATVNL